MSPYFRVGLQPARDAVALTVVLLKRQAQGYLDLP